MRVATAESEAFKACMHMACHCWRNTCCCCYTPAWQRTRGQAGAGPHHAFFLMTARYACALPSNLGGTVS